MGFNLKNKTAGKMIPDPSLKRLCRIYAILDEYDKMGEKAISSRELGEKTGTAPHTIRKDISYLHRDTRAGSGYNVPVLKEEIGSRFRFHIERRACIVGIGKLGKVLMDYDRLPYNNMKIVAGFDSSINRIETLRTDIPVYPANEIPLIIKKEKIEMAIIAVPGPRAVETAENLIRAGIKGIINFSSTVLNPDMKSGVNIVNIDIIGDLRYLAALMTASDDALTPVSSSAF